MYSVNIKELRKAMIDADLDTADKLAKASGVNRNTIGDVISGRAVPSTDVIMKVAQTLGFTSERLGTVFFDTQLTSNVSGE